MNTTITIENEHGKYSVSAPIGETADELLDLFVLSCAVASCSIETIEDAIIEKAEEIKEQR